MQRRKKREFLDFSIKTSIFILCSPDDNWAKSASHSHMQEILNFSTAAGTQRMQTLGTWEPHRTRLRAPQLTCCIPAKNLHLKACACDSLPSAQPWAFKLGFGKSTMVSLPLGCDPCGLQPHVPGGGPPDLSGMLSQVPSKATELESTF